ncbi:MAG: arylsulfatase [Pseudomonadales bacterium]|jgi:arylsulfatase/uncharacterized sulfatase|nr:arylsulfatase [Pseudomonadales bacterium]
MIKPKVASLLLLALLAPGLRAEGPNIVILLADDAGLMDFGAYGGEASTPNIDALAQRGARFTQFRASPQCAPSRAMLLTGMDNHRAGLGAIPEVLPASHEGKPGYTMHLEEGVETLAVRLKREGYRTYMTGKWHLGHGAGDLPNDHGFDRSFVLDASGADNWDDQSYMPLYDEAPWFEDGEPTDLPEEFYSSEFLVDRMIDYLGDAPEADGPFLAYVAFQAIHIPLQAPREFIERYDGVYDAGWSELRAQRHGRAASLGLIPEGAPLAAMHASLRDWDALDEEARARAIRAMEVNAGMLEAMDFHIGRLLDHLRATGVLENTIIVVTSDNGPEGGQLLTGSAGQQAFMRLWLRTHGYPETDIDAMGGPGSSVAIGPEWASAAASPSDLFKFHGADGALRVPLILAGPGVPAGERVDALSIMSDVMPTLLDLVGADAPAPDARPMTGRSLLPVLEEQASAIYGDEDLVGIEVAGNVGLYRGRYKLTRSLPPLGDGRWRVFDVALDPGETRDLAVERPELLADMLADYEAWSREMGVIEMPEGYAPVKEIGRKLGPILLQRYWPWLLAAFAAFLLGFWGCGLLVRTGWRSLRAG